MLLFFLRNNSGPLFFKFFYYAGYSNCFVFFQTIIPSPPDCLSELFTILTFKMIYSAVR